MANTQRSLIHVIVSMALCITAWTTKSPVFAQSGNHRPHMPVTLRESAKLNMFGIESANLVQSAANIAASGASWTRKNALLWRDVEPTEGARNWSAVAALEQDLQAAHASGLQIILIVRGTPDWAQKVAGKACGPIREDKLPAFAAFMRDAVLRYSQTPYGVLYWEMWNEPDVAPELVDGNWPFGCYGDSSDTYYGGGAYAQMLKTIYPVVKEAAPAAQVIIGGLLMDCDPENLALPCNANEDKRRPGRFFEGILRAGGGAYFDIGNFHSYDRYQNSNPPGQYGSPNWANTNADGPLVLRKHAYLRKLMRKYGVGNKPMMNTESAVICAGRNHPCGRLPNENIQLANAYYVAQSYASARALNLRANIYYSYEGWYGTNMISGNQMLPAYVAFTAAADRIGAAKYVARVTAGDVGVSGVAGYKFTRNGKPLWVVWSVDGVARNVKVSGSPNYVDVFGAPATSSVSYVPLYIEWP